MVRFGFVKAAALLALSTQVAALVIGGKPRELINGFEDGPLQDIVTWDEHSLFVRGERILFYSGEFHPFRLPVPDLWLDVLQKIRAMGYNGVSFYVDWSLHESNPGHFTAEGVFAWEPFFDAAKKAGIYLLARPGPYINAEVSGGGFPGWLQRVNGTLRAFDQAYLDATDNYARHIGQIIAAAQITNGGPVILFQPENEYTIAAPGEPFPVPKYMNAVYKQFRDAGIVVPFISNDAAPEGHNAPGKPAPVDIYGHDSYPLGFDCANPYTWPDGFLPTNWETLHRRQSPNTPYSLIEFQGGAFDPWGGLGFDKCEILLNHQFERVFYKNNFGFGVTIFSIYMTYGGTNWGNLGHPGGYTSYDYGAVIRENRQVDREKYSQAKLLANFLQASPAYLTAVPKQLAFDYADTRDIAVTPVEGETTKFFVVRHAEYNNRKSADYTLKLPTSQGEIEVPQLRGKLTLPGRDSKIHITDYQVGDVNLLYSSAEIFTWKKYPSKTVLVVYGGPNELHEMAFRNLSEGNAGVPNGVKYDIREGTVIVNWKTTPATQILELPGDLFVYLLDRNMAYNYWVMDLPSSSQTPTEDALIVKAGYLMRTASISEGTLALTGDVNCTTTIEVVGGAPAELSTFTFNGKSVDFAQDKHGVVTAKVEYKKPMINLPNLEKQSWSYFNTLPELSSDYSDKAWTNADLTSTKNTKRKLTTPTSLYSSDYGYHTGTLLYRGHFTATGDERRITLKAQGGYAFGFSVWLGPHFLGSYPGIDAASHATKTFTLPNLAPNTDHILTVVIDTMGLDENYDVGEDAIKLPRGILDYELDTRAPSAVTWKLTGNLGGEQYRDHARGPLNEGGLAAERRGLHLPRPPLDNDDEWSRVPGGPRTGIDAAGVAFFVTRLPLDLPRGYDIPLSFRFANATQEAGRAVPHYRVQLYVNGWQFGKYVNHVGPQTDFPVPEGILDYRGENWVGVALWAMDAEGAGLGGLELVVAGTPVQWGFGEVGVVEAPAYVKREGAY